MLLKNKIIQFIRDDLKYSDNIIGSSEYIIFTWKGYKLEISSKGLFKYGIILGEDLIFSGNYFQLLGFLKGIFREGDKEQLRLKAPSSVLLEITKLIGNSSNVENENKYKEKITELQKKISQLQSNNELLNNKSIKSDLYKKEVQRLNTVVSSQSKEIKSNKEEIENLKKDCQEAAELINTLYYKSEEIEIGIKRYKIDHFPKDVQEFIKDLITEYYNK